MNKLTYTFALVLIFCPISRADKDHNIHYKEKIAELTQVVQQAIESKDFQKAFIIREQIYSIKDSMRLVKDKMAEELKQTAFDLDVERQHNKIMSSYVTKHKRSIATLILIIGLLFLILHGSFRLWKHSKYFNKALQMQVDSQTESVKKMNEKLIQNNKELKKFNHIASHDIKEPIRNIGSFVKLIKRKIPAEQQVAVKPYFDIINNSCNQIYTLIEDIMQYTKLGSLDNVPVELIDLDDLVSTIQSNLQTFVTEKNAHITTNNLESIHSNRSLLFIILKNLIENGIKYNESTHPVVEINYVLSDYGHELHVKDNGIGISNMYRRNIFELFTRLHTRSEYEGTGLGLSIVESCLSKLGGVVNLKSEVGKGSNFIITLPEQDLPLPNFKHDRPSLSKTA